MSEREEELFRIEESEITENVLEVYVVPRNPPLHRKGKFKSYLKIYPIPWWKRCFYFRWLFRYYWECCCCCCDQPGPPVQVSSSPPPAPAVPPPTIVLRQGMLAIGGLFYLLITPQGSRCQFVVAWSATGGVGQLTVNLDVQESGSASFRRLATGLGANDQYTFTGPRATYLFRATVTDSRGQSTFGTLSVTCP